MSFMPEQYTSTSRPNRSRSRAIKAGIVGFGVASLGLSVLLAPHSSNKAEGVAACKELNVSILNGAKHIVAMTSAITVSGKAELKGVTYVFDDNTNSVTKRSGSTPVIHAFPSSPATKEHTIVAVPDYSLGQGTFGSVYDCKVVVTLHPEATSIPTGSATLPTT